MNRWSAAVGNTVILVGIAALFLRSWKAGGVMIAVGGAVTAVGHAAEGNLAGATRDLARHPIWSIRADVGLAREVIVGRLRPSA